MPYDPRMLQMAQLGLGMMGPQQGNPFANQPADQPDPREGGDPAKPGTPKQPPSLLDMVLGLGRMTRPQYDKAIAGQGAYGISPQNAARVSPWAFLGSLGLPGGAGWGGSGSGGPG